MSYKITDTGRIKTLKSEDVNYVFDKGTGFSAVWGKTHNEDPIWSPFGPFIADIELTTKCKGPGGRLCKFCYKANNPEGIHMSYDTFRQIFDRLPDTLQQIAFGVDAQCESNPDTLKIMNHCRVNGVIPNVTVADISNEMAGHLSRLCGAVAVSRYDDKDICYNSVKKLTDRGMDQVNIHIMISEETLGQAFETIRDCISDPRLSKLNSIVFLSLKQKGRGVGYTPLEQSKFKDLVDFCLDKGVGFGFDSCSAMKFLKSVESHKRYDFFKTVSEPCESARFSIYISADGKYYPCSFIEDHRFYFGVPVLNYDNFMDIWNNDINKEFRLLAMDSIEKGVGCHVYDV